jgi:hypothetical protein
MPPIKGAGTVDSTAGHCTSRITPLIRQYALLTENTVNIHVHVYERIFVYLALKVFSVRVVVNN